MSLPPLAQRYARQIVGAWQLQWALSESPAMAFAQIQQESAFRCDAVSRVGASGCAQFMPGTAQWIAELLPAQVRAACPTKAGCPLDPVWAFNALAVYDRRLWSLYPEESIWRPRWKLTLASYNGGPGWAQKERAAGGRCLRAPSNCEETHGYVAAILDRYRPQYIAMFGDARSK